MAARRKRSRVPIPKADAFTVVFKVSPEIEKRINILRHKKMDEYVKDTQYDIFMLGLVQTEKQYEITPKN